MYSRTTNEFADGNFRVKGDVIDIYPSYADNAFKIHFLFGNEIEVIELFDPITNKILDSVDNLSIYPANMFATSQDVLLNTIHQIQNDLKNQIDFLKTVENI